MQFLLPEKSESKPNYNEPSMTMLSNAFFKPSVQTQSVSALEMAPAVQQLMGRYHLLYQGSQVQSSASHVCMMTLVVVVFLTLCRLIISSSLNLKNQNNKTVLLDQTAVYLA